jgi:hypothetical protein
MDYYAKLKEGCGSQCDQGRDCLKYVTLERIGDLRTQFWRGQEEPVKFPAERKVSIDSLFKTCQAFVEVISIAIE